MRKLAGLILAAGLTGAAGGCHTDPFSTQPEVDVTLPAKAEPVPEGGEDTGDTPRPEAE